MSTAHRTRTEPCKGVLGTSIVIVVDREYNPKVKPEKSLNLKTPNWGAALVLDGCRVPVSGQDPHGDVLQTPLQ